MRKTITKVLAILLITGVLFSSMVLTASAGGPELITAVITELKTDTGFIYPDIEKNMQDWIKYETEEHEWDIARDSENFKISDIDIPLTQEQVGAIKSRYDWTYNDHYLLDWYDLNDLDTNNTFREVLFKVLKADYTAYDSPKTVDAKTLEEIYLLGELTSICEVDLKCKVDFTVNDDYDTIGKKIANNLNGDMAPLIKQYLHYYKVDIEEDNIDSISLSANSYIADGWTRSYNEFYTDAKVSITSKNLQTGESAKQANDKFSLPIKQGKNEFVIETDAFRNPENLIDNLKIINSTIKNLFDNTNANAKLSQNDSGDWVILVDWAINDEVFYNNEFYNISKNVNNSSVYLTVNVSNTTSTDTEKESEKIVSDNNNGVSKQNNPKTADSFPIALVESFVILASVTFLFKRRLVK